MKSWRREVLVTIQTHGKGVSYRSLLVFLLIFLLLWREANMEKNTKRRSLLAGFGVAAAALVVAKTTAGIQQKSIDVIVSSEPEGDGYRLTEHVKKYYRTTTI